MYTQGGKFGKDCFHDLRRAGFAPGINPKSQCDVVVWCKCLDIALEELFPFAERGLPVWACEEEEGPPLPHHALCSGAFGIGYEAIEGAVVFQGVKRLSQEPS